jgi:cell division protein FtsI (penicillin-binding protein 3)
MTNIKKSIVTRVRVAFLFIFLFAGAIIYRVVRIQYYEGGRWQQIARESRFTYQPVFATRGNIFSDNESIMATSLPFYKVSLDPSLCKDEIFHRDLDSLALLLSRFYRDQPAEAYRRKIKNARLANRRYVRLNSKQINYQEKKMMATWPIFREGKNKGGILFERVDKRFRPFGALAQRTLGYINEDKNGYGIEYTFNGQLAGKDGEALFERMAGGAKPVHDGTEVKALPGHDIKTTLDINLQDVAHNALYKALVSNDAEYGCVILMEVKTGEIKAISNLGYAGPGLYLENYNYAIADQGRTEPGSTFKLASMMALLEHTKINLSDTIDTGNGTFRVPGGNVYTDIKIGGYGKITVKEVFEKSSNVGITKLIDQHFKAEPKKFTDLIYQFGLNEPLGFQMAGEARPRIITPADKSWSRTSLTSISIGYELKLSPLQTLAYYNAVANNGVKMQPMIVKEIRHADKVIEQFEPKVLNAKICSDETLAKLKEMLEGVVEHGTGKAVRSQDYKVAGKTGTARKFKNGQYIKSYSTSFAGYFPADNPKYSCIVLIDSPKKARQYAGDVAAPVFRELADKCYVRDLAIHKAIENRVVADKDKLPFLRVGMQEEVTLICNKLGVSTHTASNDDEWVRAEQHGRSYSLKPNPVLVGKMPNVSGMSLRDALYVLGNQGLKVKVVGSGRVQSQSVASGTAIQKGNTVTIVLS